MSVTPVPAHLALIWLKHRATIFERVTVLLCAQRRMGELTSEERDAAEQVAHKLAGTLGTFGCPEGSDIAGRIDRALSAGPVLDDQAIAGVCALISELKELVEQLARSYESPLT